MAIKDYEGEGIVVHWDSDRCFHSGRCFNGAPEVFDPKARPWVTPGALPADALAAVIDTCPSGALTYTRSDGGAHGRRGYAADADPASDLVADEFTPDLPEPTGRPPGAVDLVIDAACTITPRRNGPLLVEGPVRLTGSDGSIEVVDRLFLCRCGGSADKPRCDGTHKRIGFEAPGVVPTSRKRADPTA